jgi:hypothetical protein
VEGLGPMKPGNRLERVSVPIPAGCFLKDEDQYETSSLERGFFYCVGKCEIKVWFLHNCMQIKNKIPSASLKAVNKK